MKKPFAKTFLLALAALLTTACSLDGDADAYKPRPTVDPAFEFHFNFDQEGVPFLVGQQRELNEETRAHFAEQVVGYGWEWVQTREIQPNGCPKIDDYYQGIIGIGPSHFFLESQCEVVEFYHSDATNRDVFRRQPIVVDPVCGRIFFRPQAIEPPFVRYFETAMLYNFDGTWHIAGVEYLGQRQSDGALRDVWGWSEYKRMSAARLDEIRRIFNSEVAAR